MKTAISRPRGTPGQDGLSKVRVALALDAVDQELFEIARAAIKSAITKASQPAAVAKRIAVEAMKHRNRGRVAARRRHKFIGVCEASRRPLEKRAAVLDELEPVKGYFGNVRWVCPKCNGSGQRSCGSC